MLSIIRTLLSLINLKVKEDIKISHQVQQVTIITVMELILSNQRNSRYIIMLIMLLISTIVNKTLLVLVLYQ